MACRIVIGGQYGSEGKGKVVGYYARQSSRPYVVRCGGPNSGHTVRFEGRDVVLRAVPAGIINADAMLFIAAGSAIDEAVLFDELEALSFDPKRLVIDPRAVLITDVDRVAEEAIVADIASTGSGVGAALVRRMQRRGAKLARESKQLTSIFRVEPVAPMLHHHLDTGGDVIVEGTQGFGLSLLHGIEYPYATARDTSASGFASEVGLSPRQIDQITLVIRTYPIRVGGKSGPFEDEISWEDVALLSGSPDVFPEYTSVTRRLRRVAKFNIDHVRLACTYNRPTSLAVMGIDRLDYGNSGVVHADALNKKATSFLSFLEERTGVRVGLVGTGFGMDDIITFERPLGMANGYRAEAFTISGS